MKRKKAAEKAKAAESKHRIEEERAARRHIEKEDVTGSAVPSGTSAGPLAAVAVTDTANSPPETSGPAIPPETEHVGQSSTPVRIQSRPRDLSPTLERLGSPDTSHSSPTTLRDEAPVRPLGTDPSHEDADAEVSQHAQGKRQLLLEVKDARQEQEPEEPERQWFACMIAWVAEGLWGILGGAKGAWRALGLAWTALRKVSSAACCVIAT